MPRANTASERNAAEETESASLSMVSTLVKEARRSSTSGRPSETVVSYTPLSIRENCIASSIVAIARYDVL